MGLFNPKVSVDEETQQFVWNVLNRIEQILKRTILWKG